MKKLMQDGSIPIDRLRHFGDCYQQINKTHKSRPFALKGLEANGNAQARQYKRQLS